MALQAYSSQANFRLLMHPLKQVSNLYLNLRVDYYISVFFEVVLALHL